MGLYRISLVNEHDVGIAEYDALICRPCRCLHRSEIAEEKFCGLSLCDIQVLSRTHEEQLRVILEILRNQLLWHAGCRA